MLSHYNDINKMKEGSLNPIHKTGSIRFKALCSPGYSDSILRSHWLGDTAASEPTQSASSLLCLPIGCLQACWHHCNNIAQGSALTS